MTLQTGSTSSGCPSPQSPSPAEWCGGPEAPVILPEEDYDGRPSSSRAFLSKTPAQGSSIDVQTHSHEYLVWVKLPGFSWDGITLATQKRRVLHIVADKWDNNGGHFERRVAFGYDADLCSVRAEFKNDWLRVSIPRRLTQQSCHYAPIGRFS